jgi:hypothetical protein
MAPTNAAHRRAVLERLLPMIDQSEHDGDAASFRPSNRSAPIDPKARVNVNMDAFYASWTSGTIRTCAVSRSPSVDPEGAASWPLRAARPAGSECTH